MCLSDTSVHDSGCHAALVRDVDRCVLELLLSAWVVDCDRIYELDRVDGAPVGLDATATRRLHLLFCFFSVYPSPWSIFFFFLIIRPPPRSPLFPSPPLFR